MATVDINFPASLDMMAKKPAPPADGLITRFRSDNSSYQSGDIIRIEISTGSRGQYLLPNDSYLSFDFVADASNVRLDGCAYSIFRRARILHGATVLVDTNFCGRLWNALRDIMVDSASRSVDEIRLAQDGNSTQTPTMGLTGLSLTSGTSYDAAFVLPLPLLGSLSKTAIPLGQIGASSLFLELEIAPLEQIITSRDFSTNQDGAVPTGVSSLQRFTVSNIYYNAKMCVLEPAYEAALMSVYAGRPLLLPASDYIAEQKVIPAGSNSINEKFAFNRSSVNGVLWWMSCATVANGNSFDTSGNRLDGTTHRQSGNLTEYYLSVSGKNLQSIYVGSTNNQIRAANVVQQIGRIYNTMGSVDGMGIINKRNFCSALDASGSAAADTKRFVGAYSTERFDSEAKYSSGANFVGQDVRLVATLGSDLTNQQNLYAFALCDVGYEVIDGTLQART